jgi:gas vesicle protein
MLVGRSFMMNARAEKNNGFLLGLVTGGVVGAALVALAPRLAAELRRVISDAANDVSDAASRRYRDASTRVAGAVDEATARGQKVRDEVADTVGLGARGVAQFAMAAKTDPDSRRS